MDKVCINSDMTWDPNPIIVFFMCHVYISKWCHFQRGEPWKCMAKHLNLGSCMGPPACVVQAPVATSICPVVQRLQRAAPPWLVETWVIWRKTASIPSWKQVSTLLGVQCSFNFLKILGLTPNKSLKEIYIYGHHVDDGFLGQFWVNMPQVLDLQTHCDPLYPNQTYAHAYFGNHKLKKMCHASKIWMIQLGILQTWMIHYVDGSTFVDYTWMIHYRLTGP